MKRFLSIDSGKWETKVVEFLKDKDKTREFKFLTRISEGDFRDDALEEETVLIEIDNIVYKIGRGARGSGADLSTNKMTDIHKKAVICAIASVCSSKEEDEIYCSVGLPAKEWANVSKRMDFKDYILPKGKVKIKFKTSSRSPIIEKTFTIKESYIFPESIGALFMDDTISLVSKDKIIGVLDIGNLNLNATLWQGTELLQDKSSTADLGGAVLIEELSQEISANVTPCDELIAANMLFSPDREFKGGSLTKDQIALTKEIVKKTLKSHVDRIKRVARARNWSLDVMDIIAIGGTSILLEKELKEAFPNIHVVDTPYSNAYGYLRMMCARIPEINKIIPLG